MAWLGTWANRIEITADADKFGNTATLFSTRTFPYAIHVGASVGQSSQDLTEIFDEIGSNSLKMAITKSDGTTQCYFEVERWDDSNEKGLIWFGCTGIDFSAGDATFYIYYDNSQSDNTTYGGIPGSTNAGLVWDAYYKAVYHMADSSGALTDSSGNGYDTGSNLGSGTPTYHRNGHSSGCGYAVAMDRSCRFYRSSVGIDFGCSGPVDWCVMFHGKFDDVSADQYFFVGDPNYGWYMRIDDSAGAKCLYKCDDGVDDEYGNGTVSVGYTTWRTCSLTLDYSVADMEGFVDGVENYQGVNSQVNLIGDMHDTIEIGGYTNYTGFDGDCGEVRISSYEWTDAWQVAEHETLDDNTNTYGSAETNPSLAGFIPKHIIIM